MKRVLVVVVTLLLLLSSLLLFSDVIFGRHNSVQAFVENIPRLSFVFQFFFAFLGSYFTFYSAQPAVVIGAGMLCIWFYTTHLRLHLELAERLALLKSYGYFIIGIGVVTTILRSADGVLVDAVTSRYHYYSLTFLVITYLCLLIRFGNKRVQIVLCSFLFIIVSSWALYNHPRVKARIKKFHARQLYAVILSRFFYDVDIPSGHRPFLDELLTRADSKDVYHLPKSKFYFNEHTQYGIDLTRKSADIIYQIEEQKEDARFLAIQGWAIIKARSYHLPRKVCIMAQELETLLVTIHCPPRNFRSMQSNDSLRVELHKQYGLRDGERARFQLLMPKSILGEGEYRLALMLQGEKSKHWEWIDSKLVV